MTLQVPILVFTLTFVLTPILGRILNRRGVLDYPNARSSHAEAIPRGAGLAIVLALDVGILASAEPGISLGIRLVLILGASVAGLLGFVDDVFGLGVKARFVIQFVIGTTVVTVAGFAVPGLVHPVFYVLAVVWFVTFVNVFNFMDGINGIAAVQTIVAGTVWLVGGIWSSNALLLTAGAFTLAAGAGFLPWNFPRARVFMGDAGSYGTGAWLALVSALAIFGGAGPLWVLAPFALFVFDAALTLAQKVSAGDAWHAAHRGHVYQRIALRWGHAATTLFAGLVMIALAACGWLAARANGALALLPLTVAAVLLIGYAALSRLVDPKPVVQVVPTAESPVSP